MAKKSIKINFTKSIISKENEKYTITEINKDSSADYNLNSILDSFVGLSGVSLSIGVDDDVPAVTED